VWVRGLIKSKENTPSVTPRGARWATLPFNRVTRLT